MFAFYFLLFCFSHCVLTCIYCLIYPAYGKCITNKANHKSVCFLNEAKTAKKVALPTFQGLEPIADDLYEVALAKSKISEDLPNHIGFFVYVLTRYSTIHVLIFIHFFCSYNYAKLRMLQFYYDFLLKYIDKRDFELLEMVRYNN